MIHDVIFNTNANVWINANAGSGKTTTLINRFIALLLDGVDSSTIMCITYTKVAAEEIKHRVFLALDAMRLQNNSEVLEKYIKNPTQNQIDTSSLLYDSVLSSGMPLVGTMHAVLHYLFGSYTLFNGKDIGASYQIQIAKDKAISNLLSILNQRYINDDLPLKKDQESTNIMGDTKLNNIIRFTDEYKLQSLLEFIFNRIDLCSMIENDNIKIHLSNEPPILDYDRQIISSENIIKIHDDIIKSNDIRLNDRLVLLKMWMELDDSAKFKSFDLLLNALLVDGIRPMHRLEKISDIYNIVSDELIKNTLKQREWLLWNGSLCLPSIINLCRKYYSHEKTKSRIYDYSDILLWSLEAICGAPNGLDICKIDASISHIMIDEAQDINPIGWHIIDILTREFFDGIGQYDSVRTIFIVGDDKQSIFSFQGADHKFFAKMKGIFRDRIEKSGGLWFDIDIGVSYRSSKKVLELVNQFVSHTQIQKLISSTSYLRHDNTIDIDGYVDVIRINTSNDHHKYNPIIDRISDLINDLQLNGVTTNEIMILVRKRSANGFVDLLVKHLSSNGINIYPDRIDLTSHIIYKDIIAMCMLAIDKQYDLNTAIILRSPIVGMTMQGMHDLCMMARDEKCSIWTLLSNHNYVIHTVSNRIDHIAEKVDVSHLAKFILLMKSGNIIDAATVLIGDLNIIDRYIQFYGPNGSVIFDHSVQMLIDVFQKCGSNIYMIYDFMNNAKEDIISNSVNRDGILVSTIHSAKGLESKVVIIADVHGSIYDGRNPDPIILIDPQNGMWVQHMSHYPDIQSDVKTKCISEELRLLYVAMTRAKEQLYIIGNESDKNSWSSIITAIRDGNDIVL